MVSITPEEGLQQKHPYRAYLIGATGHIDGFQVIEATCDEDAMAQVCQLVDKHEIEVWDLGRMIGRTGKDGCVIG